MQNVVQNLVELRRVLALLVEPAENQTQVVHAYRNLDLDKQTVQFLQTDQPTSALV